MNTHGEGCHSCIFWDLGAPETGGAIGAGICRRYPPVPYAVIKAGVQGTINVRPVTEGKHWCGEHKMKAAIES